MGTFRPRPLTFDVGDLKLLELAKEIGFIKQIKMIKTNWA